MTAICPGGGTSSSQPGYAAVVAMTLPAIGAFLNNIPTRWAVPFAAAIGALSFELGDFCTHDPPAVPNITANDVLAMLSFQTDVIGFAVAQAKFQQLVGAYAWYRFCKCDAVATPAPPPPPAEPVGSPTINPPSVMPTGAQPCASAVGSSTPPTFNFVNVIPEFFLPNTSGMTFRVHATIDTMGANHTGWSVVVTTYAVNHSGGAANTRNFTPADHSDWTFTIPAGIVSLDVGVTGLAGGPTTDRINLTIDVFCGGQVPSNALLPPCPPDQAVLALLQNIKDMVTLIQRQKAPFAYVPGTRHNGLTDKGQLGIQGLIGVSVILSALPAYLGNLAGDPAELFDVGWVTLGTADGWHRSVRLDHSPTLIMPIEGSETLVGWTLSPGVVVDLLELKREP